MIKLWIGQDFVSERELKQAQPQIDRAHNFLVQREGLGSGFTGWLDLPLRQEEQGNAGLKATAREIQQHSQALVVVGIGGSYLGARAGIELLGHSFHNQLPGRTAVYFAGHNLSSDYHADLLDLLAGMDFSVNVISKSGTTTEPAIAFRLLKNLLEKKYGEAGARKRIYATTDAQDGALRSLAQREGYKAFTIPADIGGRYSVLTPVGLLPMAVAGLDIDLVMAGAAEACRVLDNPDISANPCYRYAALRNILHQRGKGVELLAAYEPGFHSFTEWWKQLFGESEGKDGKGIFPAAAIFSTDLHSLGQYIQDGTKLLFETVIRVAKSRRRLAIPSQKQDLDQLNYLAGKDLDFVNSAAFQGTLMAHTQGNVPNIILELQELSEHSLGYLFYFMEKACAISGYILGVNPFDQPGVEAYKKNMFALLGKPGY